MLVAVDERLLKEVQFWVFVCLLYPFLQGNGVLFSYEKDPRDSSSGSIGVRFCVVVILTTG